jgi:carbon storage regulator
MLRRHHAATTKVVPIAKECAMLVLTRKLEEKIKIGDHIVVTVLQVKGNRVSIGIEAPRDVRIMRTELSPRPAEQPAAEQSPDVVATLPFLAADAATDVEDHEVASEAESVSASTAKTPAVERRLRVGMPALAARSATHSPMIAK